MKPIDRLRILVLLSFLIALVAGQAYGQQRPSLESTRAVMCEAAAARGDSYRPYFCPAECPCTPPGTVVSCEQTSADAWVAAAAPPYTCEPEHESCNTISLYVAGCASSSQNACDTASPNCPAGESCARNSPVGSCSISGDPCGVAGTDPCPQGETCNIPTAGTCAIPCFLPLECPLTGSSVCSHDLATPCTSALDCPVDKITLSGVGSAEAIPAASCRVDLQSGASTTLPINSNDALECVSQVEALTGPCQPAP